MGTMRAGDLLGKVDFVEVAPVGGEVSNPWTGAFAVLYGDHEAPPDGFTRDNPLGYDRDSGEAPLSKNGTPDVRH